MGKQGPCYHCGVTSTPLWRNGPPEKPVLCNACGSRWRTKGTLANYTPLHSRVEPNDFEEYRVSKVKSVSFKSKETKLHKRKQCHNSELFEVEALDFDQNFHKIKDEETSNRSSSSSAISYSDSFAQFGGTDASEFTGSSQTVVWDALVPSRKRTCVSRPKHSSVEKLTKDLYSILHEQQFSYFSGSSEEDLIFESGASMVSVEIGHGSILMKHPNAVTREEESEASSLSVDNKTCPINEAYSGSASLHVHIDKRGASFPYMSLEKAKKPMGQGTETEHTKRDKSHHEKFQILRNHSSPLTSIDLKAVVTIEEFVRHLTPDEQQQLMKYLPSIDTGRHPDGLRSMFDSPQFAENISSFQKLLAEGVFDLSFSEMSTEECKTLKRLALVNLTKSKWTEHYNLLKDIKHNSAPVKRNLDGQNPNISGPKSTMRSPRRVVMKTNYDMKDLIDNELCFSPRSLFAFPPNKSSLMLDAFQFTDESFDQDILLDVPSNGSFPLAELLYPSSTFAAQEASASSSPRVSLSQPYITS